MIRPSKRVQVFQDSIFGIMSKKANEHNAINLSQGFPDFDGPDFVKEYALEAIKDGKNQYSPFPGIIELRESVSQYLKSYYDLDYCKEGEVSICCGATEGIFLSILSIINPGDEVIVFEPFYDSYISSIQVAGGIPKVVTLNSPDFSFTPEDLENVYSSQVKAIILNNPHNPTGRVFTSSELKIVRDFCLKYDLMAISDEVYEFLTFDKEEHIPLASLEGMQERTLGIYSAGKTFGLTGWKIGWVCAPERLSSGLRKLHQYITFCVSTPMQYALARSLMHLKDYVPTFKEDYQSKRDLFYSGMKEIGFDFKKPEGTYFMMVPIHQITKMSDVDFAYHLIEKKRVAAIPPSAFYLKSREGEKFLRFCFAKKEETLLEALKFLKELQV